MADGLIWADCVLSPATAAADRDRNHAAGTDDEKDDGAGGGGGDGGGELWLGAGRDAENLEQLRAHGITHVLNVADDVPSFHEGEAGLTYLCLGVADFGGDSGISRTFSSALEFVQRAWATGGHVLVHCANGSNRSATVAIALVMQLRGVTLARAWSAVHSRRTQVAPLADNRRELLEFEQRLRGAVTMREGRGGKLVPIAGGN